jgi:3',5'-cyclic AMP phosphodiesterase CpdA
MVRSHIAGALFVLLAAAAPTGASAETFSFVQLSDVHWGFNNVKINPDYAGTYPKAIAEINKLKVQPDFLVFTGDETHITGDDATRKKRMAEFKAMTAGINVKAIRFLPGEHDVGQDNGADYKQFFGDLHYTFDYKGVHFVALDNVSDPDARLGDDQLNWLAGLLKGWDKDSQIILLAHRPLIDVYDPWDWRTKDADRAMALLKPFTHVTLFYGHIHQKRIDQQTGFAQYAAQGMMFPLPKPGSQATAAQIPWDADHPYRGLGFREVTIDTKAKTISVVEYAVKTDAKSEQEEIEDDD